MPLYTQSWSEHVNVQKAQLPGLWSLLAAGGYGSAKVARPTHASCLSSANWLNRYVRPALSRPGNEAKPIHTNARSLTPVVTLDVCIFVLFSALQVFASDVNFARSFLDRLKSRYIAHSQYLNPVQKDSLNGISLSSLQADRIRSSCTECEVVIRMYTKCFLHLLGHMDPSESERDAFYQDLLSRVSQHDRYYCDCCRQFCFSSVRLSVCICSSIYLSTYLSIYLWECR